MKDVLWKTLYSNEITRILKISRNTCYKYLKFVNFNAYIKENKRAHYLDQYKEVLLSLIKKDSLHHHKQRYTGTRAYEYLVENYPDFKYAKTSTIKYFIKRKKNLLMNKTHLLYILNI